jgi:signal transduction histidine kinase
MISVSGYYLLDKIEISNHKIMLQNMISQFEITYKHLSDINKSIKDIHKKTRVRITIIDFNGVVLFESNRAIKGMENHITRPEILLSNTQDFGSGIRHSASIGADLLYVAQKSDGFYIRMAYPLKSINERFLKFWVYEILLFLTAMILSFWIALKINTRMAKDLDAIKDGLDSIIAKKYDTIFDAKKSCVEFDIIAKQINRVSKRLEKRNRQKIKHTHKLKELNKQQGDIISAISHEFKNPVAAIMGYASSVREDEELSKDIRDKFLDKVLKNAQKISYMIDRLSMAIKLESNSLELKYLTFDIRQVIEEAKDILLQKYKDRDIVIEVATKEVRADKVMFENLFVNLMENALKYSEEDIHVRLENTCIKVVDKGIGINEVDITKLTKRFYRVDTLTWDNSMGVGLYIVKYILKLHGINLVIKSNERVGSEFCFDISKISCRTN